MQKNLRSLDQSLNAATDSARKFARAPVRTAVEETVMKPASETPPAPGAEVAPAAPADGEERAAGR